MNRTGTILVVSLLLACVCMPSFAVAENETETAEIALDAVQSTENNETEEVVSDGIQSTEPAIGAVDSVRKPRIVRRNKYLDVKNLQIASEQDLQIARARFRNDTTPENRQKLKIAAQNHFLRTTDRMIGRLEFMQARIEIAEQQGYAPEGASESIGKYILRLEDKGSEIRSADTAGDFASAARDIRKTWREIRAEMLRHTKYMIAARIGTFLEKSEILSDRLDEKSDDLEAQGIDTKNLRSNLEDYDNKIKCVSENYEDAKEFFDDGNTEEARKSIHEANVCIRDANHILKEIFKELREYRTGSVVLNGTGILTAEGSGRAMIRGAIEMSLTADAGSLSVCDRAGDVNITISGNGTRTQQDSTMVYTGFNGTAYINGTDVTVTIRGSGVDLMAEGKGTAVLVGNGSYSVTQNGEAISSGEWREPDGGSK